MCVWCRQTEQKIHWHPAAGGLEGREEEDVNKETHESAEVPPRRPLYLHPPPPEEAIPTSHTHHRESDGKLKTKETSLASWLLSSQLTQPDLPSQWFHQDQICCNQSKAQIPRMNGRMDARSNVWKWHVLSFGFVDTQQHNTTHTLLWPTLSCLSWGLIPHLHVTGKRLKPLDHLQRWNKLLTRERRRIRL